MKKTIDPEQIKVEKHIVDALYENLEANEKDLRTNNEVVLGVAATSMHKLLGEFSKIIRVAMPNLVRNSVVKVSPMLQPPEKGCII